MLKKEDQDKIERYLQGDASEEEARYVESLFAEGESNLSLRHYTHKHWEESRQQQLPFEIDRESMLEQIHSVIDREKKPRAWENILRVYAKVAAVLLIPMMALILMNVKDKPPGSVEPEGKALASIYAPLGARTSFRLPDGTEGTLNSGSTLTYSTPFKGDRIVTLDGEAWFEVAHDQEHPFRVSVRDCSVEVLGTRFNVNAYQDVETVEVVLAEGRVKFVTPSRDEIPMNPAERLQFSQGVATKMPTDPEPYHAWTEGKLMFRGASMAEVMRRLERWYHVDIRLADKTLESYSFFATFDDDTLEEVLKFLSMTSPMSYKILPKKHTQDGEISRREVILYSTKK